MFLTCWMFYVIAIASLILFYLLIILLFKSMNFMSMDDPLTWNSYSTTLSKLIQTNQSKHNTCPNNKKAPNNPFLFCILFRPFGLEHCKLWASKSNPQQDETYKLQLHKMVYNNTDGRRKKQFFAISCEVPCVKDN